VFKSLGHMGVQVPGYKPQDSVSVCAQGNVRLPSAVRGLGRVGYGHAAAEGPAEISRRLDPRVTWRAGDDDTVTAEWALGPHRVSTDLRVDAGGRLLAVSIRRWESPAATRGASTPSGER
jgi:hypothetical protein